MTAPDGVDPARWEKAVAVLEAATSWANHIGSGAALRAALTELGDEYRRGREEAAQAIADHRDQHWPLDGDLNPAQRTTRRHMNIAIQVAGPVITAADAAEALRTGQYIACYNEENRTDG